MSKYYYRCIWAICIFFSVSTYAQNQPFITKWYFPKGGSAIQIIPTTAGTVNYSWTSTSGTSNSSSFTSNGSKIVSIPLRNISAGNTVTLSIEPLNLRSIQFGSNNGSLYLNTRSNLKDVVQWGAVPWNSMRYMFAYCNNLNITTTSMPDLTNVTDMAYMFCLASSFNGDMGTWNTANVTDMSAMFNDAASFNQNLSTWNLNSLINGSSMFSNSGMSCENYSLSLKGWDLNPNTKTGVNFTTQTNMKFSSKVVVNRNHLINAKTWSIDGDNQAAAGSPCDIALPINFGNVSAIFKNAHLSVFWSTATEQDNSYFEIEASADGTSFTQIGTVKSKATSGNSQETLQYHFSTTTTSSTLLAVSIFLLAGGFTIRNRKNKMILYGLSACMLLSAVACNKANHDITSEKSKDAIAFIRIKQVDHNGTATYSKIVKVIVE